MAKVTVNETSLAYCKTTSVYSDDQNVDSFLSSETDLNPRAHKVEISNEGKNLLHVNVLVVCSLSFTASIQIYDYKEYIARAVKDKTNMSKYSLGGILRVRYSTITIVHNWQ